jgi:hypothetical protein
MADACSWISELTVRKRGDEMLPDPAFDNLKDRSFEELGVYFRQGVAPKVQDMAGDTQGAFLAWSPQVGWFMKSVIRLMFRHWLGKRFHPARDTAETGDGINLFSTRPRTRYPFRTNLGPARMDGSACLRLDYNVGLSLWGLVDDVRKIADHLFLGQIYYKFLWRKQATFYLYFVLAHKS